MRGPSPDEHVGKSIRRVLLQASDAGLSRSGQVSRLVSKLQLPAEGTCNDLALDLGDSVTIDICYSDVIVSTHGSRKQCWSDQPASASAHVLCGFVSQFVRDSCVTPVCCKIKEK